MLNLLFRRCLITAFCISSLARPAAAQSLSGTVTTRAGEAVPSDDLAIEAQGDCGRQSGRVSNDGGYEFAALSPGHCRLSIKAAGYMTQELSVTLREGESQHLNLILSPLAGNFPAIDAEREESQPGIAADDPRTREAAPSATTLVDADDLRVTSGGFSAADSAGLSSRRWTGSLEFRWAPLQLAGRAAQLTRPGLGGLNRFDGEERLSGGLALSGTLWLDRLYLSVNYRPEWNSTVWNYSETADDLARDLVTAANAGTNYRTARQRADPYSLRLLWRINDRQQLLFGWSGSPSGADGTLRWVGRRVNPGDDLGIKVQPLPGGVTQTDSVSGAGGRQRATADEAMLRYTGVLTRHLDFELSARLRNEHHGETPDAAADQLNYTDLRRAQVFAGYQYAGFIPVTSPGQYHFGGLGLYSADAGQREQKVRAALSSGFNWRGSHKATAGFDYDSLAFHDNPMRSGPRGENAPLVYLRAAFGFPVDDSMIRLRRGATVQIGCAALIDPTSPDFLSACPVPLYGINNASLTPPQRDLKRLVRSFFVEDQWQRGPLTLVLGARRTAAAIGSPNSYHLFSDVTGATLTGPDGYPVGSREDDYPYNPVSPQKPIYPGGEGVFIAGHYNFPAELSGHLGWSWDLAGAGHAKFYGAVAHRVETPSEELSADAFENDFNVAYATFANPDLSAQSAGVKTSGGGTTKIKGGTRLGTSDVALVGLVFTPAPRLRFEAQARYRRLGRVLSMTQNNSPEGIANWTYDIYLYQDATLGTQYCLNCAPGQYSLFPGYTPAWTAAGPNVDARGYLSKTLANPGENTPTGLFPKPRRTDLETAITMDWSAIGQTPLSLQASARYIRSTGNYSGQHTVGSGIEPPETTSQYKYPLSGLTRSTYASGRIEEVPPAAISVTLSDDRLFVSNLSAALRLNWETGMQRTPMLALPGWQHDGDLPGINPAYYAFDLNQDGVVDQLVLRDYTPVQRGSLGRTPDRTTADLRLNFFQRLGLSNLNYSLTVLNLTNRRAVTAYDDQLLLRLGYVDPAVTVSQVARAPKDDEPPSDLTLRSANPWYGKATATQAPRTVEFGVAWSF